MKLYSILVAALVVSSVGFAHDPEQSVVRSIRVNPTTVRLVSSQSPVAGYHKLNLAFYILPANSCEENKYSGLLSSGNSEYTALITQAAPFERCKQFARPEEVAASIYVRLDPRTSPGTTSFKLNGAQYHVRQQGSALVLEAAPQE